MLSRRGASPSELRPYNSSWPLRDRPRVMITCMLIRLQSEQGGRGRLQSSVSRSQIPLHPL